MFAGRHFNADMLQSQNIDCKKMKRDPLVKKLKEGLIEFWEDAMIGLEVQRFPDKGQGIVVRDVR